MPLRSSAVTHDIEPKGAKMKRKPLLDDRGNILNGIKVCFQKGLGFNQNPRINSSAYCIDDNKLVYILAKQIVQYDLLTQTQKVLDWTGEDDEITCFKHFKNVMLDDHIVYALASNGKSYPSFIIKNVPKDTTQKYVLSHLEKEENIVLMEFVNEHNHVCVLSVMDGAYRVSLVNVRNKEVVASESIGVEVVGMIVPHSDDKTIVLYNVQEMYVFVFGTEIKLINLQLKEQQIEGIITDAVSAVHSESQIYLITDCGHLVSLKLSQNKITQTTKYFLGTYETVDQLGNTVIVPRRPSSICCNQYSILIGYYHIELFSLLKVCSLAMPDLIIESINFTCPMLHKIVRMSFACQTMAVCIIVQVKQNDRYGLSIPIQSQYLASNPDQPKPQPCSHSLPQGKLFPIIFNLLLHDTLMQTLRSPVQSILTSTMLVKKILEIALLPTKKLMLVLSGEKKIKAIRYDHVASISFDRMMEWEYALNQNDSPTSLDVHALTMMVAVGLKEGLKLFVICAEGLKSSNIQFPFKNCECVRYSKLGHRLIAGSLNQIIVINPYENRVVNTIQLGSGYAVRQLTFFNKDLFIYTVCANGSSTTLSIDGAKLFEVWNKTSKCICSAYDHIFDITVVSYAQNTIKFYRDHGSQQFAVMWTYPFNVTKMLIINQLGTIFMGTSLGKIRAYQWPFVQMIKFSKPYTQIQLHGAAVTQLRITHDYTLLISGAQDGSVFISRLQAYSDGIIVSDPQVLSSYRSNYRSFKTLYYLQNYINTSGSLDNAQEEMIGQLESDKGDFDAQYCEVVSNMQVDIEIRMKGEESRRNQELREKLSPLDQAIEALGEVKAGLKTQIGSLEETYKKQQEVEREKALVRMREQYKETDALMQKKQAYTYMYREEITRLKQQQEQQQALQAKQLALKQLQLQEQCDELQREYQKSTTMYEQLKKQDEIQGTIYKQRMIEQLTNDLQSARETGQLLRKKYNKTQHQIDKSEEKIKYFQQLTTELRIDIDNVESRMQGLELQKEQLRKLLLQKDKVIFAQEKAVKQLITSSINNYSHEEYLKHRNQQLLDKQKYMLGEIAELDRKYAVFQEDFSKVSVTAIQYNGKIMSALKAIQVLKAREKVVKQNAYLRRYKHQELYQRTVQLFHEAANVDLFKERVKEFVTLVDSNGNEPQPSIDSEIEKRDVLIRKVNNTNDLRKIDDSIRKTIMVKLNRQTVSLTCEVNELRKQKKKLSILCNELLKEISTIRVSQCSSKQNSNILDIIPANISIIRGSKHPSSHRMLPFQLYHQNKTQKGSVHTKTMEQASTQLPSISKNSFGQQSGDVTNLFGVLEKEEMEIGIDC